MNGVVMLFRHCCESAHLGVVGKGMVGDWMAGPPPFPTHFTNLDLVPRRSAPSSLGHFYHSMYSFQELGVDSHHNAPKYNHHINLNKDTVHLQYFVIKLQDILIQFFILIRPDIVA